VKITRQGISRWDDTFDVRVDPNNRTYYWLTGKLDVLDTTDDTDVVAVRKNYISVTPIQYDLTDYRVLKSIRSWKLPRS
jgi:5'-nucleotidase